MGKVRGMLFSISLVSAVAAPAAAQEAENNWSFTLSNAFVSRYLWRGFLVNDSPAIQPTVGFGYKGFTVTSWSSIHQQINGWGQNWVEHDLTVNYTHSLGKAAVSAGYIFYAFPGLANGASNRSHEFYGGLSLDTILQPSFTYYRDVDQGDGNYFYFSTKHSQKVTNGVVFNIGLGAGLNNGQWIDQTTISNFDINASIDIPWGKVVFSPFFTEMIGHRTLFGHHNAFGVTMSVASLKF